eukprot:g1882.t1
MSLTMKEKILEAAEKRVRKAGFAEMSFRDLASDVGIKSASVHYHFPTKHTLGEALVDRYAENFQLALDEIETGDLRTALTGFMSLYANALVLNESICLCAVMGAEANGLPEEVNRKTAAFFESNRAWLKQVFDNHGVEDADNKALTLVAALEGGMIIASTSKDKALFEKVAATAIEGLFGRSRNKTRSILSNEAGQQSQPQPFGRQIGESIGVASADDTFDGPIKARKAVMSLYAWNLGQLAAMAKGETDYDPDTAVTAAENIRILASMNNGSAWPQGSDNAALPGKTRAKVEAWTTYPESAEINKSLVEAATAMAAAAGGGLDGVKANIGAIGGACSTCHKKFRESQ